MRNGGIFCERMRSRNKTPKMQKLLNWAIVSWIIYNLVMIVYKVRIARAFLSYFPMAGR